jgi:hypothetical protein
VRYTPAAGYTGPDELAFVAADANDSSAAAHVHITVKAPPPVVVAAMTTGHHGPVITIPGDCMVDPRTNMCILVVGCQPGGDITGCTGNFAQAPSARRAVAALAKPKSAPRLLKTAKFRIPAGKSKKVKMRLTAAGRAQLRHKGKLVV